MDFRTYFEAELATRLGKKNSGSSSIKQWLSSSSQHSPVLPKLNVSNIGVDRAGDKDIINSNINSSHSGDNSNHSNSNHGNVSSNPVDDAKRVADTIKFDVEKSFTTAHAPVVGLVAGGVRFPSISFSSRCSVFLCVFVAGRGRTRGKRSRTIWSTTSLCCCWTEPAGVRGRCLPR